MINNWQPYPQKVPPKVENPHHKPYICTWKDKDGARFIYKLFYFRESDIDYGYQGDGFYGYDEDLMIEYCDEGIIAWLDVEPYKGD